MRLVLLRLDRRKLRQTGIEAEIEIESETNSRVDAPGRNLTGERGGEEDKKGSCGRNYDFVARHHGE